jgi:uncharacterized membrane protein YkoI
MKAYKLNQTGSLTTRLLPLGIGMVIIAGVLVYVGSTQKPRQKINSAEPESVSTVITSLPSSLLSIDKVKELVTAQKPGLGITGIELERQDTGVVVYQVRLTDGTVLAFNAQTGAQVATSGDVHLKNETNISPSTPKQIGFDKAREIALNQKPQGVVQKMELEPESGVLLYRVYFVDGGRVDVRAVDGTIVAFAAGNTAPTPTPPSPTPPPSRGGNSMGTEGVSEGTVVSAAPTTPAVPVDSTQPATSSDGSPSSGTTDVQAAPPDNTGNL